MFEYNYTISTDTADGTINFDVLINHEVKLAFPEDFIDASYDMKPSVDKLTFHFSSEVDTSTLNAIVNNHSSTSLAVQKHKKNIAIDYKTSDLIGRGFEFDGNQFSLSANAQKNWLGLKSLELIIAAAGAWPQNITTIEDGEYSLTQANIDSFCATAFNVIATHRATGRALKLQVNACTTQSELDAVVDDR